MIRKLTYTIADTAPYINWPYFDYAWGVGSKGREQRAGLRAEAEDMLSKLDGHFSVYALFGLFDANSDGDDIIVGSTRLPMLRQQQVARTGEPCLCLADFIRPLSSGCADRIGIFATSTEHALTEQHRGDPYMQMLMQTLADRLAEAAAERMHEEVRKHYWGYAPDEHLTMQQLHIEAFQGIRPAVGYPSLPDTSLNFIIDDLIDLRQIGIRLTESGMMMPHASVSGLMMAHPKARYFSIGKIGEDQLRDYAHRRGIPVELARRFLNQ